MAFLATDPVETSGWGKFFGVLIMLLFIFFKDSVERKKKCKKPTNTYKKNDRFEERVKSLPSVSVAPPITAHVALPPETPIKKRPEIVATSLNQEEIEHHPLAFLDDESPLARLFISKEILDPRV